MKLTRAGTGVAPKLHLSAPAKTSLRELQFDGTDRLYDEHFGAGTAFDNMERPRLGLYLDQVFTADAVQTNFSLSALDYIETETETETHDLSHAYEQSLPGSVAANIVEDPLTELGSSSHLDLNPNEMALLSPGNGSEMA